MPPLHERGSECRPSVAVKQLLRSWTKALWFWRKTVRDAEKTKNPLQRFAFWLHSEYTIGMQGHGQLAATEANTCAGKSRYRCESLSVLYVIVRLTKAARGNGSVA